MICALIVWVCPFPLSQNALTHELEKVKKFMDEIQLDNKRYRDEVERYMVELKMTRERLAQQGTQGSTSSIRWVETGLDQSRPVPTGLDLSRLLCRVH